MEWSEGGGEWDNCNSVINKYISKKNGKHLRYSQSHYFLAFLLYLLYKNDSPGYCLWSTSKHIQVGTAQFKSIFVQINP